MKLTQLLERLEYEVVQGDDQIEVTESMIPEKYQKAAYLYVSAEQCLMDIHI